MEEISLDKIQLNTVRCPAEIIRVTPGNEE